MDTTTTSVAASLVEEMVAAEEWPEPPLLEAILAQGHEAVPPLLEVVRRPAEGWPEEAPLVNAVGLLDDERRAEEPPLPSPALPKSIPSAASYFPPAVPIRAERRIGRNDPCWCGSGKKYKRCHLRQDQW